MKHTSPSCRGDAVSVILRWPTERSRDWTCSFVDSARANPGIVAVVAIGSAVRPNVPSADLDLIVVHADTPAGREKAPLEVDLRGYSEVEVDAQLACGSDLLVWAVQFGQPLYQQDHYWDRLVDRWRGRLPLPSPADARNRAANARRRLVQVLESGDADASQEQAVSYLTHLARAELLDRGVYPASRPELPAQLRAIGSFQIAEWLERVLQEKASGMSEIEWFSRTSA